MTKRFENIRRMAVENKNNKVIVRFPLIGDKELGVKIIKKSEYKNLVEMRKLKARTSTQVMAKVEKIDHYMIGEAVKKYTDKMFDELIGNCFINDQIFDKLKKVINDGIDLMMAKMRLAYAIDEAIKRHKQHAKIAAAIDTGELVPVYNGKVTRKDWLKFMGQTMDSCMPGADGGDLIDPFTGLSDEEQAELDEMAREAWEESRAFDHDDKEDRDEELREIMNVNSEVNDDQDETNDDEFPF
jgi:hypothetical protein